MKVILILRNMSLLFLKEKHIIVHYLINNMSNFEKYLNNSAKLMRKDGDNLFEGNVIIVRRILKPCD